MERKKIAYVSGASGGIGYSIAEKLAEAGYDLALSCHKNTASLESLAKNLKEQSRDVLCFSLDVSKPEEVEEMASGILSHFGRIDVVVNNAGISEIGLITDMTNEKWDEMIGTNLSSVFYTCRAFVPQMVSQKSGAIINISSIWGNVGASCEVAYSAAKGGVNSFTRALAKELAPSGISVNAISCGVIDTKMNSHLTKEERLSLEEEIPMGRYGKTTEVASAVLSVINMPYTTGQIIGVDGGFL